MTGIVGPTFADLRELDLSGQVSILATAFYSWGALKQIEVSAKRLLLPVRLDLDLPDEWKRGLVNPEALLAFVRRHRQAGVEVDLRVSAAAHAKAYVGRNGGLIGSANLTVSGFSGDGHELLWVERNRVRRARLVQSLSVYAAGMPPLSEIGLQDYVNAHRAAVRRFRRRNPVLFRKTDQDRPPPGASKAPRHGNYDDFLAWLAGRTEQAAQVIRDRGMGVSGNLQGHIRRHFFGLRQWFLFDPATERWAAALNPDTYVLHKWSAEEARLRDFVEHHAEDEPGFSLDTWKSYLHVEAGGRAGSQASSGNLKRMIPLVARYLEDRRD